MEVELRFVTVPNGIIVHRMPFSHISRLTGLIRLLRAQSTLNHIALSTIPNASLGVPLVDVDSPLSLKGRKRKRSDCTN